MIILLSVVLLVVQWDISLILALIVLETYTVHKERYILQPLSTQVQSETYGLCIWTYLSCEVFVSDYCKAELIKQLFKIIHIEVSPFARRRLYCKDITIWSTNDDITVCPYLSNHSISDQAN